MYISIKIPACSRVAFLPPAPNPMPSRHALYGKIGNPNPKPDAFDISLTTGVVCGEQQLAQPSPHFASIPHVVFSVRDN